MGRGAEKKDCNQAVVDLEGWKHNTPSKKRTKRTGERKGEKEKRTTTGGTNLFWGKRYFRNFHFFLRILTKKPFLGLGPWGGL